MARRTNQRCMGSSEPNNSQAAAGTRPVRASSARAGWAEKQEGWTWMARRKPAWASFSRSSGVAPDTTERGAWVVRARYTVEVAASDTRGNATRVRFHLSVS